MDVTKKGNFYYWNKNLPQIISGYKAMTFIYIKKKYWGIIYYVVVNLELNWNNTFGIQLFEFGILADKLRNDLLHLQYRIKHFALTGRLC